jgi:uncharacterized iron-regulated membrane protein
MRSKANRIGNDRPMPRGCWVLMHRDAGLCMACFLIVAGLTGSILAFDGKLNR